MYIMSKDSLNVLNEKLILRKHFKVCVSGNEVKVQQVFECDKYRSGRQELTDLRLLSFPHIFLGNKL